MADRGIVLSLCDRTGVMVEPWLAAGYSAVIVDLQHRHNVTREAGSGWLEVIGADVRTWGPQLWMKFAAVFAFPPCTHLAGSGARWLGVEGPSRADRGIADRRGVQGHR